MTDQPHDTEARQDGMRILLPPAALGPEDAQYLEGWCDGQQYLIMNTPDRSTPTPAAQDGRSCKNCGFLPEKTG